jgi:hypothetical protein
MFEIESNVPMPSDVEERRRNKPKYPVADLEVGQSLFFPITAGHSAAENAAQYYRRKLGRTYTVRQVEQDGKIIGFRMWRIM